jgi:hypothetical protein
MPLTGTEIVVVREVMRSTRDQPAERAAAAGLKRSNVCTAIRSREGRRGRRGKKPRAPR